MNNKHYIHYIQGVGAEDLSPPRLGLRPVGGIRGLIEGGGFTTQPDTLSTGEHHSPAGGHDGLGVHWLEGSCCAWGLPIARPKSPTGAAVPPGLGWGGRVTFFRCGHGRQVVSLTPRASQGAIPAS